MQDQYVGFRVKLNSSHLGDVVGTVQKVTKDKIELSNAILNDKGLPFPLFTVESQFIQNICILSTGVTDSSDELTPKKTDGKLISTRAQRREMLRNIPNVCNAYICPDSPPLIHRTTGAPGFPLGNNESPRQQTNTGLHQLDLAFSNVSVHDNSDRRPYKYRRQGNDASSKRRSYSMSEAVASSEFSGTESDSFHRSQNHPSRGGAFQNGSRHGVSRNHTRGGPSAARPCSTNKPVDWDCIRIEEFIDQDFDFEKNLALFDKSAFYEMVDMKRGNTRKSTTTPSNLTGPELFVERSDGIGAPLLNFRSHEGHPVLDYRRDTKNSGTETIKKQRSETGVSTDSPIKQHQVDLDESTFSSSVSGLSHVICGNTVITSRPVQSHPRCWYSPTGQRVPTIASDYRARLVRYLATGKDPQTQLSDPSVLALPTLPDGLGWGRLLETAGRSLVDYIMTNLRQACHTPQRPTQRPPARILVIPGDNHIKGAFAVTLARLLAVRGASVLLVAPRVNSIPGLCETPDVGLSSVYRTEMNLAMHLAPRPNQYGLEEDEQDTEPDEDEEDDDTVQIGPKGDINRGREPPLISGLGTEPPNLLSSSDVDSEMASCLALDQLHYQPNDQLDYSPAHRMWISRIPGLKVIRKPKSISAIPTNIRVDLVLIGNPSHLNGSSLDPLLMEWLQRHRALARIMHLMPDSDVFSEIAFRNASICFVVELGLPVLLPAPQPADSIVPMSPLSHLLVDVGLSRNLVRRLTGDLKSLPPYGLFDSGSVIALRTEPAQAGNPPCP